MSTIGRPPKLGSRLSRPKHTNLTDAEADAFAQMSREVGVTEAAALREAAALYLCYRAPHLAAALRDDMKRLVSVHSYGSKVILPT